MKVKYLFAFSKQNILKIYYTLQGKGFSLEYYKDYKKNVFP